MIYRFCIVRKLWVFFLLNEVNQSFLNESSNAETQLEQLRALETQLDDELKNSHIPMRVPHDIYLEYGDFIGCDSFLNADITKAVLE